VAFISSDDFRRYLRKHPGVFERTAQYMGAHYRAACEQLSVIGLGASVSERVAKFLLDWSAKTGASKNGYPFTLWLSHDEIANFVGATRESVTRTLSEFRNRGLIETRGSTFVIPDRQALAASDVELDSAPRSALKPQLVSSLPPVIRHKSQASRAAYQRHPIQRKRA
jgi:CRP/FNR family transcriptional regulator, cyclic AMP receptor protein